jgi:hypothetical protein
MSTPEQQQITLTQQQAQEILNFLVQCPFNQVHQLVQYLVQAQPLQLPQDGRMGPLPVQAEEVE